MYNQFYKFSEQPFNLTPDPKFLYLSPSHREALASMIYGINERKGFITLTGKIGTGKTTLIYTLLNNLSANVKTVFIYHTNTTFEQLLKNILHELDVAIIDTDDKASLLQKLHEYLIKSLSKEETLAIIIDEAQNLPVEVMEELRMLSNLETSKSKLLQIVLVGQPELEVKLNSDNLKQLKQRIGIPRHIKPLTLKECKEYINHRLKIVGSSSSRVLNSDAISLIIDYSGGIPRTINILCDNAFLIGYGLSQNKITKKIVREVLEDMKDHQEVSPPSPSLETPPPSSKKAFAFKSLTLSLLSIIALLLVLILLNGKGLFQKPEVVQLASIKKEKHTPQTKKLPPKITPTKKAPVAPIAPVKIKPKTQKEPDQKKLTKKEPKRKELAKKEPKQKKPAEKKLVTSDKRRPALQAVLKKGESLYSLSLRTYRKADETLFDLILQANPIITDVRQIPDNQKFTLPVITPESYIKKTSGGKYQVHVGTYETFELATLHSNKMIISGKQLSIEPHKFSHKDTWYRLTMGTFNSRKEALKTVNLLNEQALIYIPPLPKK